MGSTNGTVERQIRAFGKTRRGAGVGAAVGAGDWWVKLGDRELVDTDGNFLCIYFHIAKCN